MKKTKTVTGKDRKVTSTKDVRIGDVFQKIIGRGKGGKPKLSLEMYTIIEILPDCVEAKYVDREGDEKTDVVLFKEMYLHTIVTFEAYGIRVDLNCREGGYQAGVFVTEHDFMSSEQECETCGSHGSLTVDVKCKCGNTHEIELKSW